MTPPITEPLLEAIELYESSENTRLRAALSLSFGHHHHIPHGYLAAALAQCAPDVLLALCQQFEAPSIEEKLRRSISGPIVAQGTITGRIPSSAPVTQETAWLPYDGEAEGGELPCPCDLEVEVQLRGSSPRDPGWDKAMNWAWHWGATGAGRASDIVAWRPRGMDVPVPRPEGVGWTFNDGKRVEVEGLDPLTVVELVFRDGSRLFAGKPAKNYTFKYAGTGSDIIWWRAAPTAA